MTNIFKITNPITQPLVNFFTPTTKIIGDLAGRSIQLIQDISYQINQNNHATIAFFTVSNIAFFTLTHFFAKWSTSYIKKHSEKSIMNHKILKNNLFHQAAFGCSAAIFNYALAQFMQYPLTKTSLVGITATMIAARILFNQKAAFIQKTSPNSQANLHLGASLQQKKQEETEGSASAEDGFPTSPVPEEVVNDPNRGKLMKSIKSDEDPIVRLNKLQLVKSLKKTQNKQSKEKALDPTLNLPQNLESKFLDC